MKRILVAFLCLFATSAFAIGLGNDNPGSFGGNSTQTNLQAVGVDVSNRISNDTRAAAASFAAGGLGVGQGGVGQAISGGSTSNVDFNITSPKNTPAVFSGNVYQFPHRQRHSDCQQDDDEPNQRLNGFSEVAIHHHAPGPKTT